MPSRRLKWSWSTAYGHADEHEQVTVAPEEDAGRLEHQVEAVRRRVRVRVRLLLAGPAQAIGCVWRRRRGGRAGAGGGARVAAVRGRVGRRALASIDQAARLGHERAALHHFLLYLFATQARAKHERSIALTRDR